MKKTAYILILLLLLISVCGCCSSTEKDRRGEESYSITDVQGTVTKLNGKPQKILAYSYNFDGFLLGLVPPERMVAVHEMTTEERRSWAYKEASKVATKLQYSYGAIPAEQVIKLNPDLIIASTWTNTGTVQALRDLGYPVVVCKGPKSIGDVKATVKLIAKTVQEEDAGAKVLAEMDRNLTMIDERLDRLKQKKPSGLLISLMSSYGGTGSMYDALCTRAHIVNGIAAVGLKNGEKLTKELVVKADPDFFVVSEITENDVYNYKKFKQEFIEDPALKGLKALKNIKELPERSFYNANQNCVYSVMELANAAYGDVFDLSKASLIKGY